MEPYLFNNLKFLALRLLKTPSELSGDTKEASKDERYAWEMRKILHTDEYYKFYSGVEFGEKKITFNDSVPQSLFRITHSDHSKLEVSVSAIVGQNGSGKSTIVDYLIRILNNLSACILGEKFRNPETEHLHYIPSVYAELYILVESNVFCMRCQGTKTTVTQYDWVEGTNEFNIHNGTILEKNASNKNPFVEDSEQVKLLRRLCYTIFINYSMYAFDSVNYTKELTPYQKENLIRSIGANDGYTNRTLSHIQEQKKNDENRDAVVEARSWLTGLFHKTDGYQVPLFISPKREKGRIDQRSEYKLAKERLMSLLLKTDDEGNHIFSQINGKLNIVRFKLTSDNDEKRIYSNAIKPEFLRNINNESYSIYYKFIRDYLTNEFQITKKRNHEDVVWNYIVEKFFKIIVTYPSYHGMENIFKPISIFIDEPTKKNIRNLILKVLQDHSHVTRKLFRSLYYLRYDLIENRRSFAVDEFTRKAVKIVDEDKNFSYPPHDKDELLPPPIFDVDFTLYDSHDTKQEHAIQFSTLSSGEKQLTFMLCSVYYHLSNIDSVVDVAHRSGGDGIKPQMAGVIDLSTPQIDYKHVCVIFDEVELYYHPDMQRKFVYQLLHGLQQLKFKNLRSIQFLIITHSPFILSDIPKDNVLFLKKDGHAANVVGMKTFGANIYSILKHSFFLEDGAIGDFSQHVIDDLNNRINFFHLWKNPDDDTVDRRIYKSLSRYYRELVKSKALDFKTMEERIDVDYMDSVISLIQEPVTHDYLGRKLSEIKNELSHVASED